MGERDRDDPEVRSQLGERVVSAARRRRWRRAAWVGVAVLALSSAIAVPLLLGAGGRVGPAPTARTGTSSPDASVRAEIYAAAVPSIPDLASAAVYIRDRVCTAGATTPRSRCVDGPMPAEVQRRVSALVGSSVRFAGQLRPPESVDAPSLVVLAALAVHGDRASLRLDVLCGPLCGQGQTLVLAETADGWRVTGTNGPDWVS